jgi:flavorubredoxin
MSRSSEFPEIINPLPIQLAERVFWLGQCQEMPYNGTLLHAGNSVFVVAGDECTAIIDAGHTFSTSVLMDQLEELLEERDLPEVRYICITHTETAHSGGTGHALARFPNAIAVGEVSDLQLIFPDFRDRLRWADPGESFDLGGTEIRVVEAVIRDMTYTRWFFDTRSHVLFSADGFAFSHDHDAAHCGHFADDVKDLDIPDQMSLFAVSAFNYMQYIDIEPYLERLDALIFDELKVELIAPTHGLPIRDLDTTLAQVREGFRRASKTPVQGMFS